MSWQEQLRLLDAELAEGAIASGEHRRRREDLLAEVSGAPLVSFGGSPSGTSDGRTGWRAANPARRDTSAPRQAPPPQPASAGTSGATWSEVGTAGSASSSAGAESAAAESAGAVDAATAAGSTSVTPPVSPTPSGATAPRPAAAPPPVSLPASPPSPTPPSAPSAASESGPGEPPQRRGTAPDGAAQNPARNAAPSPGTTENDTTPVGTTMTDPAPTTAPPNIRSAADLLAAGRPTTAPSPADNRPTVMIRYSDLSSPPPEPAGGHNSSGDERAPRPRRTALTWVAISGALLVALGGIVAGAWWLGQNGSDGAGTAQSSGADDGEPGATEPSLGDRLPALPGVAGAHDSTLAVAKGVELGLYPEHSAEILTDHGVAEVIHRASTDDDANYFLLVIPTPDERKAESLADELSSLTTDAGFDRLDDVPGGLTGQLDGRTVRGTWYASGEVAVNLWVSVGEPVRQERLRSLTDDAVGRLHDVLPPG